MDNTRNVEYAVVDYVGLIHPEHTDLNTWLNHVLRDDHTDKWGYTFKGIHPLFNQRIAVILTEKDRQNNLPKDCVYAIVEVVSQEPTQNDVDFAPISSDTQQRIARTGQKRCWNIQVKMVRNLYLDRNEGIQLYTEIMNGRSRGDLPGPRQSTFKRV